MQGISPTLISLVRLDGLAFNPSNAATTFSPKRKDAKIFENHLKPAMLVFMG